MIHEVELHALRKRSHFLDHRTFWIVVIRIICRSAKALRKRTGLNIPYTLTILPSFLIPYARVTFSALSLAIPLHLDNRDPDLVLNTLSANDPRTFGLHFSRVTERAPRWNLMITSWLIDAGQAAVQQGLNSVFATPNRDTHPWHGFIRLVSDLCQRLMSIGRTGVVLEPEQPLMVHGKLTYAGMGLGP